MTPRSMTAEELWKKLREPISGLPEEIQREEIILIDEALREAEAQGWDQGCVEGQEKGFKRGWQAAIEAVIKELPLLYHAHCFPSPILRTYEEGEGVGFLKAINEAIIKIRSLKQEGV